MPVRNLGLGQRLAYALGGDEYLKSQLLLDELNKKRDQDAALNQLIGGPDPDAIGITWNPRQMGTGMESRADIPESLAQPRPMPVQVPSLDGAPMRPEMFSGATQNPVRAADDQREMMGLANRAFPKLAADKVANQYFPAAPKLQEIDPEKDYVTFDPEKRSVTTLLNGAPKRKLPEGMNDDGSMVPGYAEYLKAKRAAEGGDLQDEKTRAEAAAARARASAITGGSFTSDMGELLGALTERGIALPAGMRSKDQQRATLSGLLSRNPGKTPDEIAEMVGSGQIDFGAERKGTVETVTAFDKGKQGDSVRSFNVGIAHLGTLQGLADALQNGDMQLFNRIGNKFAAETGNPAPTNFDAAKAIVGDEIIKAIVGGGGALADRENAQNQIDNAKSPQQLAGVIKTYKKLMAGQLKGLQKQYQSSTGYTDFNKKLSPETIKELENEDAGPPPGAPADAKQGNDGAWYSPDPKRPGKYLKW